VAAPERGLDALADRDRLAQLLRHPVGVGVVERAVEDDLGEQPGRGGGLAGAEQVALHDLCHNRLRVRVAMLGLSLTPAFYPAEVSHPKVSCTEKQRPLAAWPPPDPRAPGCGARRAARGNDPSLRARVAASCRGRAAGRPP